MTPTLSIDRLGVDSNVFNTSVEPKSDFTVSVTPRATVWLPVARRALLTADVGLGLVYFQKLKSQRSVNPGVSATGELYARRLTFSVEAGKSSAYSQPSFEIEARVRHFSENLGGGIRFTMLRGLSVGLSTYRMSTRYGDDAVFSGINLRDSLNRAEQGVRLTVQQKLTSLTTIGVSAENRQDRFELSPDRDADGYRVAASIGLAEKALVSGLVELGFRHVKPTNPLVPAFDGLVANAAVSNRLNGLLQMTVRWDRDMQYSFEISQPYYVSNAFSARVRRQLAGRFDAIVGVVRSRATYRTLLDSALVSGRRELTTTYTVDVGYRLGRDTRMGIAVSRTNRTSTPVDTRQYGTTRAGLSLNYVF